MNKIKNIAIIAVFGMAVFGVALLSVSTAQTYDWNDEDTGCCCQTASIGTLTSSDYSQTAPAQNAAWEDFKEAYEGLVDNDRLGNRTRTYNCHAYCFAGSSGWLNDPHPYVGNEEGCWQEDAGGTVKSDLSSHSCLVSNNTGKCGPQFLCRNNQYVYNPMPTDRYEYIEPPTQ